MSDAVGELLNQSLSIQTQNIVATLESFADNLFMQKGYHPKAMH